MCSATLEKEIEELAFTNSMLQKTLELQEDTVSNLSAFFVHLHSVVSLLHVHICKFSENSAHNYKGN